MWNEPSIEELSQMPTIDEVLKVKAERRVAQMHFFKPDYQWFTTGFDPKSNEVYGFEAHYGLLDDRTPIGWIDWQRKDFDRLKIQKSTDGVLYTRNLNFSPQIAYKIPIVMKARALQRDCFDR